MARQSRLIIPGIPHHITQRGNKQQDVFYSNGDRQMFLKLLEEHFEKFSITTLSYCLMTNHVHIVAVPPEADSFHFAFKSIFRKYSYRKNRELGWSGHYWQERFFSSPLEGDHLITAIRYAECNPVRAKMVTRAENYPWSSARAHCGLEHSSLLDLSSDWNRYLPTSEQWSTFLASTDESNMSRAQKIFRRGLPLGNENFVNNLEQETGRCLSVRSVGRPVKCARN